MKTKKRLFIFGMLCSFMLGLVPSSVIPARAASGSTVNTNVPLRLHYDEETPYGQENSTSAAPGDIPNSTGDGWERWSLPLGNGYFGANVFGRTATERIQLTEKTLCNGHNSSNDSAGGLNNFSETYIDFDHPHAQVTSYERALDLETAISTVTYVYGGVRYEREYFTSYIDNCMVVRLTADQRGALDFTLRPTIPYLQDFAYQSNKTTGKVYDTATKHGKVSSRVDGGVGIVDLTGHMGFYGIDFEAQYRVYTDGTVRTGTETITYKTNVSAAGAAKDTFNSGVRDYTAGTLTVENGTLEITGAKEAYIVICLGTNYDQSAAEGNSSIYTTSAAGQKLEKAGVDAKAKNDERMSRVIDASFGQSGASLSVAYATLRARHLADYQKLFSRVSFHLDIDPDDLSRTTDELLKRYQNGTVSHYLEMLYYQYGRYLMIASSRETTLPSNLQGTWNRYNFSPWGAGYWHNINEQMNYWPVFSTGLAECFEGYVNMQKAYMEQAKAATLSLLRSAPYNYTGTDGGFSIGTGVTPYTVGASSSAGNVGFTTQLFWEYYQYTMDEKILRDTVYPLLYEAAKFITKTVAYNESEDAYLTMYCDSPEQYVNGVWYYTEGTTYAQSFAYLNNRHLLDAAEILGVPDDELLREVRRQIDKYDAILVGGSGQIKEFREETYYGDLGEAKHRHISHLVGLYPGELINETTPAWLDAATVTLTGRGDQATGWGVAHRLNLWTHVKNGERAYDLYRQLLTANTATNLWDLHTPFQIDGNFGGLSGVTEMLMQSHEGYIEPLAAVPASWANGVYTGLVARGGFTVDAAWQAGSLTSLSIGSTVGGTCTLRTQNISRATVRDSQGRAVRLTVIDKDTVSFETAAGESYTVSSIPTRVNVAPVTSLAVAPVSSDFAALVWEASADAAEYRIYAAADDAPAYTLLATSKTPAAVCVIPSNAVGERIAFCVTAVDAQGNESTRTVTTMMRTGPTVSSVTGVRLADGTLQISVDAEGASGYVLYENGREVARSAYPVLLYAAYDAACTYTATACNLYGESAPVAPGTIEQIGTGGAPVENTDINILEGTPADCIAFSTTGGVTVHNSYPIVNGFDGDLSTRWACADKKNAPFTVTVTLDSVYKLKTLRIYDFREGSETTSRSDRTVIEVYANGTWTKVHENVTLDRVSGRAYSQFDLGFATAEKLRLTFSNSTAARSATIYEVTCTAAYADPTDRSALLRALEDTESVDLAGADVGFMTHLLEARADALATLSDSYATNEDVSAMANALRSVLTSRETNTDADLSVSTTVYTGSTALGSLKTEGGLGGKTSTDLAYVLSGSGIKTVSLPRTGSRTEALAARLDLLVGDGAKATLTLKGADTATGTAATSNMPAFVFEESGVSITGGELIAVDGTYLTTPTDRLTDAFRTAEWHAVALYVAPGASNTSLVSLVLDGTVYTVRADRVIGAVDELQLKKSSSASGKIALDRLSFADGADAVLFASRDLPVSVCAGGVIHSVSGNTLRVAEGTSKDALIAALGNRARIYTNASMTAEASTLATGNVIVLSRPYRGTESAYTYFTLRVIPASHTTHMRDREWSTNETHHWYECTVCGERIAESRHEFDRACDPHCAICGYVREDIEHSFTSGYLASSDGHRALCACGVADTTLTPHTGSGPAAEGVAEVCTVCGYEIAPALPVTTHEAQTAWYFDSTHHWHACTGCSEHTYDRAAHTMGLWVIVKEATEQTDGRIRRDCACGYRETGTYALGEQINPPATPPSQGSGSGRGGCRGGTDPTAALALGASAAACFLFRRRRR